MWGKQERHPEGGGKRGKEMEIPLMQKSLPVRRVAPPSCKIRNHSMKNEGWGLHRA